MIRPEQVHLAVEPVDMRWDTNGIWLCQRRLHRGGFKWPESGDEICILSQTAWQWLVAGIEWQRLESTGPTHWQV